MIMARIFIIMYVGTVMYVHIHVGTKKPGHKSVWEQTCLVIKVPIGTDVWGYYFPLRAYQK